MIFEQFSKQTFCFLCSTCTCTYSNAYTPLKEVQTQTTKLLCQHYHVNKTMSRYHHVSTSSSYDGGHTAYARFIEDVDDAVLGLCQAGDL